MIRVIFGLFSRWNWKEEAFDGERNRKYQQQNLHELELENCERIWNGEGNAELT